MQSIVRRSSVLGLFCSISLLVSGAASAAEQAKPSKSQPAALKARVAKGIRVDLAASRLTTSELARLRPEYEKLKPRARTNTE